VHRRSACSEKSTVYSDQPSPSYRSGQGMARLTTD
jgi:hypothetical protein